MPVTKTKTKSSTKTRTLATRSAASTPRFRWQSLVVVGAVLSLVGVAFVLLSHAGAKPYSRLDCTLANNYMGVAGRAAQPTLPGYLVVGRSFNTRPSRQACLDNSSEAMVAKIYRAVMGADITTNQAAYKLWLAKYTGLRGEPASQFAGILLATSQGKASYAGLTADQKIVKLYARILSREPDTRGQAHWTNYLRKNGLARTVASLLNSSEALRKGQVVSNAALATLPATYRPQASACGHGLNQTECIAFIRAVQSAQGKPCQGFTKGGSVVPLCKSGSAGGITDGLVEHNIDGTNVTLNKALAPKFKAWHRSGKQAGYDIQANDVAGPGYGSYRTHAMQQKLIDAHYPAARIDTSMHQWGLAVDLSCNGKKFISSSSACQQWIRSTAANFGFKVLSTEAWHYSSNGR